MYRFCASRGGHAPGHLPDALLTCTDQGWQALQDSDTIWFHNEEFQKRPRSVSLPPLHSASLTGYTKYIANNALRLSSRRHRRWIPPI
jgi:hypothetical protein